MRRAARLRPLLPFGPLRTLFRAWLAARSAGPDARESTRELLVAYDDVYRRLDEAAARYDDGVHVKHRLMRYHDFFVERVRPQEHVRDVILTAARTDTPSGEQEDSWYSTAGDRLEVAWSITPLSEDGRSGELLISGMDVTERKHHEAELRRSRARLVEAGGVERRRLERNLHDGAQQRLVSLSLSLRLAQGKLKTAPDEAERLLASASDELMHALEELRELARGIHPAILTDRGLEPALQSLVLRAPMPVTLAEAPDQRLPEGVEAAAYYVVAEALTNVAKYANATAATVRVSRSNGRAVVEVADDGVGGADPALGSGLRGLADRVEALDGLLHVESVPGQGTTIRAEIPVGFA